MLLHFLSYRMPGTVTLTKFSIQSAKPTLQRSNDPLLICLPLKCIERWPSVLVKALWNTVTLCTLRLQDQSAYTFQLPRHLKADMVCLPSVSAQWSFLAPADEGSAKFYYTLNKPTCSPMRSRHYRVSGVMDTVKWLYYYCHPDSSSLLVYESMGENLSVSGFICVSYWILLGSISLLFATLDRHH